MSNQDTHIPEHVALILDGNRRWAKQQGIPTLEGHRAGYNRLKEACDWFYGRGVKELSAYIFSTENWNRSQEEVSYLMDLARWIFKKELKEFEKRNVKLRVVGLRERVSDDLLKAIDEAEERTKDNDGGVLNLCFNYGGRPDILHAAKTIVKKGYKPEEVTEEVFSNSLTTSGMRDVDLLVRTSEQRLSGFLPWESVYAEILFLPDILWPEFSEDTVEEVLTEYSARQRRFGK